MNGADAWRAAKQWVPFSLRTMGYGAVSCALGPLTREHGASLWAMRRWCESSVRALQIRVDVEGLENVPTDGPFVYASNHQSIVDIIVLGSVLVGDYKWAAKRSLMRIPFLGWHLKLAGHVPVDRGAGGRAATDVVQRFEQVLAGGKPLLVFPEGTRTRDGSLRRFKNGAFQAAVTSGVPIVPVALEGTFRLMRKGASDTGGDNDRVVRVRVGAPLSPLVGAKKSAAVADLRERSHAAVAALFEAAGGRVDRASEPAGEHVATEP